MATSDPRQGLAKTETFLLQKKEAAATSRALYSSGPGLRASYSGPSLRASYSSAFNEGPDTHRTKQALAAQQAEVEDGTELLGMYTELIDSADASASARASAERAYAERKHQRLASRGGGLGPTNDQGNWAAKCLDESKLRSAHDLFNPGNSRETKLRKW
jgi:hypothetical protein